MFRTQPDTATVPPAHVDVDPSEQLVPLVVLELSLDAPSVGWPAFLATLAITVDDIGREAIAAQRRPATSHRGA